jgi:hypothetical protein
VFQFDGELRDHQKLLCANYVIVVPNPFYFGASRETKGALSV